MELMKLVALLTAVSFSPIDCSVNLRMQSLATSSAVALTPRPDVNSVPLAAREFISFSIQALSLAVLELFSFKSNVLKSILLQAQTSTTANKAAINRYLIFYPILTVCAVITIKRRKGIIIPGKRNDEIFSPVVSTQSLFSLGRASLCLIPK